VKDHEDAYGRLLLAYLEGDTNAREIAERDDRFIQAGVGAAYFEPFRRWPAHQRQAMRFVRGRVLDVGAGAGRVALHLQERGHEVVAIDISPLAIEVCRRRGIRDARVCPFEQVDEALGRFDTVVMWGNNFGLFGSGAKAKRMLRRLRRLTSDGARILAESRSPYGTEDPDHLAYHERNRRRGRMAGQLRLRIRHRGYATPWFDYLIVSPEELEKLLDGTGWHMARLLESDGDLYAAVIEKD
jgi:SAM-dependent methyltransferase